MKMKFGLFSLMFTIFVNGILGVLCLTDSMKKIFPKKQIGRMKTLMFTLILFGCFQFIMYGHSTKNEIWMSTYFYRISCVIVLLIFAGLLYTTFADIPAKEVQKIEKIIVLANLIWNVSIVLYIGYDAILYGSDSLINYDPLNINYYRIPQNITTLKDRFTDKMKSMFSKSSAGSSSGSGSSASSSGANTELGKKIDKLLNNPKPTKSERAPSTIKKPPKPPKPEPPKPPKAPKASKASKAKVSEELEPTPLFPDEEDDDDVPILGPTDATPNFDELVASTDDNKKFPAINLSEEINENSPTT